MQICLHLIQIWYQDVPYIPFNVCQILRQFDDMFAVVYDSFLHVCKTKKK